MSFKELVASYDKGETSFEELILEIRCESCYVSVYDEVQKQLGTTNKTLESLAKEFPTHHMKLVNERGLDF
ncbi:hypothetical protein [Synechococcus sp. MIT S1220]|uniref:hypothetical protein n=1 Tax=Synechococcus sp. MIT S1220 TaxID=3082549 RepID=UPI0039AFAEB9